VVTAKLRGPQLITDIFVCDVTSRSSIGFTRTRHGRNPKHTNPVLSFTAYFLKILFNIILLSRSLQVLSSVQVCRVKFLRSYLIFSVRATRQLTRHHCMEYSVAYYPNRVTLTNCFCYICDVVMNMVIIIRMMIRFDNYDDNTTTTTTTTTTTNNNNNNNNNINNRVKTKVIPVIIGANGTI